MLSANTIARPYAQAIFDNAIKNNSLEEWKNILIFLNTVIANEKIKKILFSSIAPKYLSQVLIKIGGSILHREAKNFIKLLSENKRFKILNNILEQFLKLEASYKNIIIIDLKTAFPFSEKQNRKIQKILEQFFLKKIKLIYKIDPHIINGMIIKINDTVFDFSIHNHLKQLFNALNF